MTDFDFSTPHAATTTRDFILAAGRAFFVESWLHEGEDENGRGGNGDTVPGGCDILDYAPETEAWALDLARDFVAKLEERKGCELDTILERWLGEWSGDREPTELNAGWYAAMQALGHGVGLHDFGVDDDGIPSTEVYGGQGYVSPYMTA